MNNRKDNKGRNLRNGESQRADGKYMFRYIDLTGKRQTVYSWKLTEFDKMPKGKKEDISLREKEEEISLILKSNNSIQAKQLTLNEMFEIYIDNKRYRGRPLAPKTKINYRSEWHKNVSDTVIGHKKISDICRADIISFYSSLVESGLSYGTVTYFHKLMNSIFNYAMDSMELINKNPCRRALNNIEGRQKETIPLTKTQDKALMKYVCEHDKNLYPIFLLMRETMVRIGECIAVTKSDINFENSTITIDKQLLWYKAENESGARLHISATKGRNIRRIPLKEELLHILKELADNVTDDFSIDGVSGFLFMKDGGAYMPSELRFDMCNLVREYNVFSQDKIEEFTPKTLRHTGCTMYAREGMDISLLQYIMGHKSPYTTMRFYNHVTEERVLDTFKEHIKESA